MHLHITCQVAGMLEIAGILQSSLASLVLVGYLFGLRFYPVSSSLYEPKV